MADRVPPEEERYETHIAWSDEDGAFVARFPDLPYAGAHGGTAQEALEGAREALAAYLEVARELGKPVPEPKAHALP